MRFVANGPDIPNQLVKEWRDGEVIFLAGAGVSAPSKLPLFEGLALKVYEKIGDPLFDVLKAARRYRNPASRKRKLADSDLPPDRRVEADLFFEKQFDRLFSALEKRRDPEIRGRPKTRDVRTAVEEILLDAEHGQNHCDLLELSLAPSSSGDRSKPLSCRIATTNFDLLFEKAWGQVFQRPPLSFDARMAPRPGAHDFDGIIHLHGSLASNSENPPNYILSSRDFARVYLRSGVIGNYVYDLIRRYRIVLVGYSADDPPMRYLMDAIGEDASLFDDMRRPFALTDLRVGLDDPEAALAEAVWSAKEITPIFYTQGDGRDRHAPLWSSIHEWASWARDETTWVERKLAEYTSGPRAHATAFERAFVQDLLAVLSTAELERAIEFLSGRRAEFSWIESISAALDAGAPGTSEARS